MRNKIKLLIVQIAVMPLVILVFNLPFEKRYLSVIANIIFWLIALTTISFREPGAKWIRWGGLHFLVLAVLPVTILRFISWDADFSSATLLGISGAQWHKGSNLSYLIMILPCVAALISGRLKSLQK